MRKLPPVLKAAQRFPALTVKEAVVADAMLNGVDPARALSEATGRTGRAIGRDVSNAMASERVRRTIAAAVAPTARQLRSYVLERLVTEAEDAREGGTRIKALELIGNLPGVDVWKPQDDRAESLVAAGSALQSVLAAIEERLANTVVEVQAEPSVLEEEGSDGEQGDDDAHVHVVAGECPTEVIE